MTTSAAYLSQQLKVTLSNRPEILQEENCSNSILEFEAPGETLSFKIPHNGERLSGIRGHLD